MRNMVYSDLVFHNSMLSRMTYECSSPSLSGLDNVK